MKASELRLGNYVSYAETGTQFRVAEIATGGLEVHNDKEMTWIEIEEFEGIPLTEEWLLKFGFQLYSVNRCRNFMLPKNKFFISKWMEDEPGAGFEEKGAFYWSDRFSKIEFVHQLQNLFHALTGEELTISEQ